MKDLDKKSVVYPSGVTLLLNGFNKDEIMKTGINVAPCPVCGHKTLTLISMHENLDIPGISSCTLQTVCAGCGKGIFYMRKETGDADTAEERTLYDDGFDKNPFCAESNGSAVRRRYVKCMDNTLEVKYEVEKENWKSVPFAAHMEAFSRLMDNDIAETARSRETQFHGSAVPEWLSRIEFSLVLHPDSDDTVVARRVMRWSEEDKAYRQDI